MKVIVELGSVNNGGQDDDREVCVQLTALDVSWCEYTCVHMTGGFPCSLSVRGVIDLFVRRASMLVTLPECIHVAECNQVNLCIESYCNIYVHAQTHQLCHPSIR